MTEPTCTGIYVGGEYDEGPARLVHDEFTFCPVHDNDAPLSDTDSVPLSLNAYQHRCKATALYPECGTGSKAAVTYAILGLVGEAGEVADKWKKVLRGDHELTDEVRWMIAKELGDNLWYIARVAEELDLPLATVARNNLAKLADRNERGVIKGSGDLR